ncbi:MAG: glycosyl hydrolase [Candidatus Azobacteroides sp.]|nr:glycosyl hydrolase [Candidatus Azobacteroides sp.]
MSSKQSIVFILFFFFSTILTSYAQTRSGKRGISYDIKDAKDLKTLSEGLSWFYNWSSAPANTSVANASKAEGMEFIPMIWNGNFQKETLRNFFQNNPNAKYILTFNEPNFTSQACMKPSEAAAKWPEIEAIADEFGLKIVGPAVNFAPGKGGAVIENGIEYTDPVKYLDDFFTACSGCRVDYIAVHCYMNYVSALEWYIGLFKKYGKPIWLTEFCAWESGVTDAMQRNFIAESVNYLESDPDVFRYAWFTGRSGVVNSYPYMQLLKDASGELTEKGMIYTCMSSWNENFFFTINDTIPAEQYAEATRSIHLRQSSDDTGRLNVCDFTQGKWVEYNVDIPADDLYDLYFRVSVYPLSQFSIWVDQTPVDEISLESAGSLNQWTTRVVSAPLKAGKQKIRLQMQQGELALNWIQICSTQNTGIKTHRMQAFEFYTTLIHERLEIISKIPLSSVRLQDMTGKIILQSTHTSELDLTGLPKGVYLLRVENNQKETGVVKVMKM